MGETEDVQALIAQIRWKHHDWVRVAPGQCAGCHVSNPCEYEQAADALDRLMADNAALVAALRGDAADLWRVTNAIKKEIDSRYWILDGRGNYEWDDDRYRQEAHNAFAAVLQIITGVQSTAQLRFWDATADHPGRALLEELARLRFDAHSTAALYDAALARAEAAEKCIGLLRRALASVEWIPTPDLQGPYRCAFCGFPQPEHDDNCVRQVALTAASGQEAQ